MRDETRAIGTSLLDAYEIFDVKQGGMGTVYMVRDPAMDMSFAVKTFQDKYLMNNEAVERFRREAQAWIWLRRHMHVVQALFIKTIDHKPHIFLEYVDGPSLKERIAHGPMPLQDALALALQFCDGMAYANAELGLIHRDIKPSNIMLSGGDVVKITDFGLVSVGAESYEARAEAQPRVITYRGASLTVTGAFLGTAEYMAPEQWFRPRDVDTRADIYSFGVVLYEMLCGRRPFELGNGEPAYILHARQLTEQPPDPREFGGEVPDALARLVLKCLEKESAGRVRSFDELTEHIREIYEALFHEPSRVPECTMVEVRSPALELILKGMSLASLDDHESAICALDEALALEPDNVSAINQKGLSHAELGDHAEALRWFRKAETHWPDNFEIHSNIAHCLNETGQYEAAVQYTNRSIALMPQYFSSWNNKGIALSKLGRDEEAVSAFQKALEIDPGCPEAWNNLGWTFFFRLGKTDEAMSCFGRAIKLNPRYLQPYFNVGALYLTTAQTEKALEAVERILAIAPEDLKAVKMKHQLIELLRKGEE